MQLLKGNFVVYILLVLVLLQLIYIHLIIAFQLSNENLNLPRGSIYSTVSRRNGYQSVIATRSRA